MMSSSQDEAILHLSRFIQARTTSYADVSKVDLAEFKKIHEMMLEFYPRIASSFTHEVISGGSILFHWKAQEPTEDAVLLMAHLDVVPVVPGTEGDWEHDAYSGDVADGYVWGRGAQDIKCLVAAELEAVEHLLSLGLSPRRDVYLSYGQDEETLGGLGHETIARILGERGVKLAFVLDEGGAVEAASSYKTTHNIALIALEEKGYANLLLKAPSQGGHSSRPGHGTSLGEISRAIARLVEHPFVPSLNRLTRTMLASLAPVLLPSPLKTALMAGNDEEIIKAALADDFYAPYVRTTVAPTMIEGSSLAANVLPQEMNALVNLRLQPSDTPADALAWAQDLTKGLAVSVSLGASIAASSEGKTDGKEYQALVSTIHARHPDLQVVPSMTLGGTDARFYEPLSPCCARFSPFYGDLSVPRGAHGTNEKIGIKAYLGGIDFLIDFVKTLAF